jgi:hypothetical protein
MASCDVLLLSHLLEWSAAEVPQILAATRKLYG